MQIAFKTMILDLFEIQITFELLPVVVAASLFQNTVDVPPDELVVLQGAVQVDGLQGERLLGVDSHDTNQEKSYNEVFHSRFSELLTTGELGVL